jgi:alpha-L-fucosidase
MSKYGDSIYNTRGGPTPPADWGVTTQRENKIYVHVLNWSAPMLALAPVTRKITAARALVENSPVEFTQNPDGVILKLPPAKEGETDRVIVLTTSM